MLVGGEKGEADGERRERRSLSMLVGGEKGKWVGLVGPEGGGRTLRKRMVFMGGRRSARGKTEARSCDTDDVQGDISESDLDSDKESLQ